MLQLEEVHTYIGPVHILSSVSLSVQEGETVCLVGRNGAGKTTTIKSVMGLYPVKSGKILLDGTELNPLPAYKRSRMGLGYAPEDSRVFAELTVRENVQMAYWLSASRQAQDWDRLFSIFPELKRLLERRGFYCSGGEKKMVAIARALALNPKVLLLDEPFEGLAPVVVTRFIEAVKKIKEQGVSMLVAESNVITASKVADRLYAIDRGEIIYAGDPKAIFNDARVMETIRGY